MFEVSPAMTCPIRCTTCPQDLVQSAYKGERLMSFETFCRCIVKVPDPLVSFAGFAEPYLNPLCTEMILYAAEIGKDVQLYTTCVGMDMCDVDEIRHVPFKILCLHLPDRNNNATIKITDDYLAVVDAMAEAFPAAQMMQLGSIHPAMMKYTSRIKGTYLHTRAGNIEGPMVGKVMMRKHGSLQCRLSPKLEDNVLLPDGRIVSCCSDWGLQHVLGNLLTQSWTELCEGEAKRCLLAAQQNGEDCLCRRCEFSVPA